MTNGGITEGNTEYSGFSDLSPATLLWERGDLTCKCRVASGGIKGPSEVCATSLPILFMKYLAMLLVGASVSYGQSFSGTAYNLNNGDFQIIQGNIDSSADPNRAHRERMARYERMNAELSASINAMRAEAELQNQTRELRKQTELLRKIANE